MGGPENFQDFSSHDAFVHDSIASLGYDWSRISNKDIAPKSPLVVFLPKSARDVSRIFKLLTKLSGAHQTASFLSPDKVRIRSKGHSSNKLVLGDAVICTELMTGDLANPTVTPTANGDGLVEVGAGATLADIDRALERGGYCLPVVGDHGHITAGGFASVGGMGAASHLHGMFVDNVEGVTLVDRTGNVSNVDATKDRQKLDAVLAGLGRDGVIADLKLRVIHGNRDTDVREASNKILYTFEDFVKWTSASWERSVAKHKATHQRAAWLHTRVKRPKGPDVVLEVGNAVYYIRVPIARSALGIVAPPLNFPLRVVGSMAGHSVKPLEEMLRPAGLFGLMFCPPYSTVADIEAFTDMAIDSSKGDPMRMLSLVCSAQSYPTAIAQIAAKYVDFLNKKLIKQWLVTTKVIRSNYLDRRTGVRKGSGTYHELTFYCWSQKPLKSNTLDDLVQTMDDACIAENAKSSKKAAAYRYMHTQTASNPVSPLSGGSPKWDLDMNIRPQTVPSDAA